MKKSKTLTRILIILFPLGIIYCILHCLGKDFVSFIGGLLLCGIGVLVGIYITDPERITATITAALNWGRGINY